MRADEGEGFSQRRNEKTREVLTGLTRFMGLKRLSSLEEASQASLGQRPKNKTRRKESPERANQN